MSDSIERALEETVPILKAAQRAKLLSPQEISDVVRRRRDHEYAVASRNATRSEFLKYAAFERELASVLSKRAEKRKLKKQKVQLVIGKSSARVNLVYSRAVKKFHGDVDLWLHYARHCVRTGSTNAAGKVFAKALGHRGDSEDVWMAAVAFHFDTCGDARGARALAQRALRALPDSINMWKEYFRMEVCYLAKLISRRIAMGLPPSGTVDHSTASQDKDKETETEVSQQGQDIRDPGYKPDVELGTESETRDGNSVANKTNADSTNNGSSVNHLFSFWDGGVPMTVYKNACRKVKFTPRNRAEFWEIVTATPYTPVQLLRSLCDVFLTDHPDCIVSRLVNIRLNWDVQHSRYREEQARLGEERESKRNTVPHEVEGLAQELVENALLVLKTTNETLTDSIVLSLDEALRNAVQACVESFTTLTKPYDRSGEVKEKGRELKTRLKSGKLKESSALRSDGVAHDSGKSEEPGNWSVEYFADMLEGRKCPLSRQAFDALKSKALVPFRQVDQERVLCAWISAESNYNRLHEICEALLSMPPLTALSLQSGIRSQMKLQARLRKAGKWSADDHDKMLSQTRKLFAAAVGFPAARADVDLWLDYTDFERRIARDAKQASVVNWKAMKTLDRTSAELFNERQMLRNLTQAVRR